MIGKLTVSSPWCSMNAYIWNLYKTSPRFRKINYNRSNCNCVIETIIFIYKNQTIIPLKMITFAIKIFCELLLLLLITLIAGTSLYHKTHNQVRIITQTLFQAIKSRTIKSKYQLLIERKYLSSLWESLNKFLDKTSELDSVIFNKMVIKYHKAHGRKSIIAFILKDQFSRKTIKALKNG